MIPKIIHTGLFGSYQFSDLNRRCTETWVSILPDYASMSWFGLNGPKDSQFFQDALKVKPVNASNYIKLWALYHYGGVFMDFDVEVIKPFDLSPGAFVGFQRSDTKQDCINGAVIGADKGHPYIKRCLDQLDLLRGDTWPVYCGCTLLTETLNGMGMKGLNEEQMVGDIKVYSKEAFYPWGFGEKPDRSRITDKTFACHWWEGSWVKEKK